MQVAALPRLAGPASCGGVGVGGDLGGGLFAGGGLSLWAVVRPAVLGFLGMGGEDFAGLLCGADDAFADEVEEAGDVLEADGGRGVGAEDADALPGGLDDLGVGPGAGHHRLVPDVVVDDVALAAAVVSFPADQALA